MPDGKVVPMRRSFSKGDLIFRQGDEGLCAYIIEQGRVEIFVEDDDSDGPETIISRLSKGEIFGEMAIIDTSQRIASARALEDCRLSLVSQDQLSSRLEEADAVIRLLVNILLKRLRMGLNKKNAGKNSLKGLEQSKLHRKQRHEYKVAIERIRFERELEDAFQNNELSVQYQPIIRMLSHQVEGFEALIRWKSPTKGTMRPDIFMGVAEEGTLIIPIGRWILQKAIEDLDKINAVTHHKPFMAINVSGKQIEEDPQFFDILCNCLKKTSCETSQIKLEITERILVEGQRVTDWIRRCQNMGVTVALDDFGTGYSNLGSLTQLKVDNFKIDKSFVDQLSYKKASLVVVRGLIDIARGLNIPVVAEGIETKEQEQLLAAMGCTYGQGYIYARPLDLDRAIEFCNRQLCNENESHGSEDGESEGTNEHEKENSKKKVIQVA